VLLARGAIRLLTFCTAWDTFLVKLLKSAEMRSISAIKWVGRVLCSTFMTGGWAECKGISTIYLNRYSLSCVWNILSFGNNQNQILEYSL